MPGIPPGIVFAAISGDTEFSQKLEFFGIRNYLSDLLFQKPELASHSPKVQLVATSAADATKSGVGAITLGRGCLTGRMFHLATRNQIINLGRITGAPGGNRTPNPRIRNPMLYPLELRAQIDLTQFTLLSRTEVALSASVFSSCLAK